MCPADAEFSGRLPSGLTAFGLYLLLVLAFAFLYLCFWYLRDPIQ